MSRTNILLAAAIVSISPAGQAQVVPSQVSHIVTSGEAQTKVTPDRAMVTLGVQSRALTATAAAAENARRQRAIIDTLKALGLGADQLGTQNYSVSPEVQYDGSGSTPRITGYIVSNTVRADLNRIDMVGTVIDAALAKGANEISGIQFTASNVADARRSALGDAVRNARADAEVLAKAAGGTLGQLLELTSSGPEYRPIMSQVVMKSAAMARVPTPIEAGDQVVTATVSGTWQFIPGPPR